MRLPIRARNIKPGFLKNEALCEVAPLGRILFAGLWMLADREGRLEDRPKRIKVDCLPYDECDIDALLWDLEQYGFILRYQVGECRFIQIPKFLEHQHPHANEVESKIPVFSVECKVSRNSTKDSLQKTKDSGKEVTDSGLISESLLSESLTPKSPNGGPSLVGSRREKPKRKIIEITKALGTARLGQWKVFWGIYPCHEDVRSAMDAFERIVTTEEIWGKVHAGAIRYRAKADADPELKLKYGQGWINGQRFEDEETKARASPNARDPAFSDLPRFEGFGVKPG